MRQRLERFDLLRDIVKILGPLIFVALIFNIILFVVLPAGEKPKEEKIVIQNISPCLEPDWKLVEKITERDTQWICADMKTDRSSINLSLDIFNSEDEKYVYSDDAPFSSGSIAWIIYPPLPAGKYKAEITAMRGNPIYAKFEFEIVKGSD